MGRNKTIIYPQVLKHLEDLGWRIKLARLRRKLSVAAVAERAKVSRSSVWEVEKGSPSVAIGIYLNVLMAIGMAAELDRVLENDPLGRLMQDSDLPTRERRKRGK